MKHQRKTKEQGAIYEGRAHRFVQGALTGTRNPHIRFDINKCRDRHAWRRGEAKWQAVLWHAWCRAW